MNRWDKKYMYLKPSCKQSGGISMLIHTWPDGISMLIHTWPDPDFIPTLESGYNMEDPSDE